MLDIKPYFKEMMSNNGIRLLGITDNLCFNCYVMNYRKSNQVCGAWRLKLSGCS